MAHGGFRTRVVWARWGHTIGQLSLLTQLRLNLGLIWSLFDHPADWIILFDCLCCVVLFCNLISGGRGGDKLYKLPSLHTKNINIQPTIWHSWPEQKLHTSAQVHARILNIPCQVGWGGWLENTIQAANPSPAPTIPMSGRICDGRLVTTILC